jgi:hypothetical protein
VATEPSADFVRGHSVRAPSGTATTVALTVWLSSLLVACGCCPAARRLYPGPARPGSEVAALSASASDVRIEAVDGASTLCFPGGAAREVIVLPGEHTVEVSWRGETATSVTGSYSTATALLRFTADAGRRYVVGCQRASFWISESESGRVIAVAGGDASAK